MSFLLQGRIARRHAVPRDHCIHSAVSLLARSAVLGGLPCRRLRSWMTSAHGSAGDALVMRLARTESDPNRPVSRWEPTCQKKWRWWSLLTDGAWLGSLSGRSDRQQASSSIGLWRWTTRFLPDSKTHSAATGHRDSLATFSDVSSGDTLTVLRPCSFAR